MQLEKAIGLFDNPRLYHRFAVDFCLGVEPLGDFQPIPERTVGGDACNRIGEA